MSLQEFSTVQLQCQFDVGAGDYAHATLPLRIAVASASCDATHCYFPASSLRCVSHFGASFTPQSILVSDVPLLSQSAVNTVDVALLTTAVMLVWAVAWLSKRAVRVLIPNG